jgi:hypothetical protein
VNTPIIEITRSTILQIGGCRITIDPGAVNRTPAMLSDAENRDPTPSQWRRAEAELQSKTQVPFETPSECKSPRVQFQPRVGSTYRALTGADVEIAQVSGRDGELWFAVDVKGRPVALRRIDFKWHALPRDDTSPVVGDVVRRGSTETRIVEVLGEAEIGGWAVRDSTQTALHVLRSGDKRWMSFGVIAPELAS